MKTFKIGRQKTERADWIEADALVLSWTNGIPMQMAIGGARRNRVDEELKTQRQQQLARRVHREEYHKDTLAQLIAREAIAQLSPMELSIAQSLESGMSQFAIAESIGVSQATVSTMLSKMRQQLSE